MSRIYDNWERLVAAVLRREQLWQLCHEQSRTPSIRSSVSSDFSSTFRLSAPFSSKSFNFADPKDGLFRSAQSLPFKILAGIKANVRPETQEAATGLVLFKGSPFAFNLEELLMAPSFVLGEKLKTFKNTYVVSFKEDIMVVVKRLRRGHNTLDVFEQTLKKTERIEHENIAKFRGYYYLSKDEVLGFYDYFPRGSVYTMLHGKKGENRVHLDWEARIRIAIGAAKGLLHIHILWNGTMGHGNIKASNIFVNSQEYGCIDIIPSICPISKYHPPEVIKASNIFVNSQEYGCIDIIPSICPIFKYHPPEVSIEGRGSQAADVYSFGVLLIELLSGRSPLHSIGRHETFADWVLHNARDEWTAMVFDTGLLKHPLAKKGMCDMLAVALSCVKKKPEERPNMKNVVEMLELIPTSFRI